MRFCQTILTSCVCVIVEDYEDIVQDHLESNSFSKQHNSSVVHPMPVVCHPITQDGEERFVITDIIGVVRLTLFI